MAVVLKKDKNFEFLYFKDVVAVYSSVYEPKKKFSQPVEGVGNQSTHEYSMQVFFDSADREKLEDEVLINKQIFEVGKDKNKKRKIKFPIKDDKGEPTAYTDLKGMHGMQLTLNQYTKAGKPANLFIVDKDGKPMEDLIGNGSRVNVKCLGYRNQDDQLVVSLNIVQVLELVPYEGGDGSITDDELGISLELPEKKEDQQAKSVKDEFEDAGEEDDGEDF